VRLDVAAARVYCDVEVHGVGPLATLGSGGADIPTLPGQELPVWVSGSHGTAAAGEARVQNLVVDGVGARAP